MSPTPRGGQDSALVRGLEALRDLLGKPAATLALGMLLGGGGSLGVGATILEEDHQGMVTEEALQEALAAQLAREERDLEAELGAHNDGPRAHPDLLREADVQTMRLQVQETRMIVGMLAAEHGLKVPESSQAPRR